LDDKVLYPKWPHPDYPEINKDLNRIFAKEEFFQKKENLDKIKRILYAFCRRNPIYGYIQTMSFIVARLIMVLEEEEAFWVFTIILENYLPIDYMADLTGAVIDQKVFEHIVNYRYPEFLKKLDDMKL